MDKQKINEVKLLPRYFYKIGIAVIAAGLLITALAKLMQSSVERSSFLLFRDYLPNLFLLGLFFIAWSKDRIEDELTSLIRLKAMAWAFGWGILYVIGRPLTDLLFFGDHYHALGSRQVIFSMLLVYLVVYYLNTRAGSEKHT
jgi:hypothetical protein